MKTLRSLSLLMFLALLAASCKQDAMAPAGVQLPLNSSSNTAHPALATIYTTSKNGVTYRQVIVSDSDGSHRAAVATAWGASGSAEDYFGASWSPSGGSLAFVNAHYHGVTDSLMIVDVSVNRQGVASGSNLRSIYSASTALDRSGTPVAWSATSAMASIAFIEGATNGNALKVIAQTGGTPVTVYSQSNAYVTNPSWSPDDSRLAVLRTDSTWGHAILIFNTSSWACVDSILMPNNGGSRFNWSHSGANKLAVDILTRTWNGSAWTYSVSMGYCDPTTSATISTGYPGGYAGQSAWSPNSASLLELTNNSGLVKFRSYSTDSTYVASLSGGMNGTLDWKR